MAANYKCTSVGCYSYRSPETHTLFKKLQTAVNQFSQALAFEPLKVDGILGKGTTEATLVVLGWIGEQDTGLVGASARSLKAGINGPEQLAGNAQSVTDTITLATRQSAVASQASPAQPVPEPSQAQPTIGQLATTTANRPISSEAAAVQVKLNTIRLQKPALAASLIDRVPPWAAYASGALLAIGAVFAIATVAKKRRAATFTPPATPPTTAGWRLGRSRGWDVQAP